MGVLDRIGLRKAAAPAPVAPSAADLANATAALGQQAGVGAFGSPGMALRPRTGVGGEPRVTPLRPGYNITARVTRDGRTSFETLEWLAQNYDVAAMCIAHRINDIRSLPWTIVPADGVEDNVEEAVKIATQRMRRPDGQHSFRGWVSSFLYDVLAYDAGCLYKRRDRAGRVIALEVVNGPTIQPLADYWGRRPSGDAPAYVQFYQGQPEKWFTADQLIYEPLNPVSKSKFGTAPLEAVYTAANTDIRFQEHFLAYFTEGTVPEGFLVLPEEHSAPGLLKDFQETYDAYMKGDPNKKRTLRVLPNGTDVVQTKDAAFDPEFPMFLMRKVCAAFHVTPADLGFTEDVNRATGETQADVQFRTGTLPLINYLQDIIDDFLQYDLGLPVKFQFDTGKETEDRVETAKADDLMIRAAVVTPDEVRELRYGLPIDKDNPAPRVFVAQGAGVVRVDSLANGTPIDPETGMADKTTAAAPAAAAQTPGAVASGEAPTSQDGTPPVQRPATVPPAAAEPAGNPTVEKRASSPNDRAGSDDDTAAAAAAALGGDADPKASTPPSWRDTPPNPTPQHGFDLRFGDYYAPQVAAALRSLTGKDTIAAAVEAGMSRDPINTVDAALRAGADPTELGAVLRTVWEQGYTGGRYAAQEQLGKTPPVAVAEAAPGTLPVPLATDLTWGQALDNAGITLRGITANHLARIGELIAEAVDAGTPVSELAKDINAYIEDPARAELIAHTELARMVSLASEREYRMAGVQSWDWIISAGACPLCLNEAAKTHTMGDPTPPGHPRCRCSMAPRTASYVMPETVDSGQSFIDPGRDD